MSIEAMSPFQKKLKQKMDVYVHAVYRLTHSFPKQEMYGSSSQVRRAALSVVLNYIEGFARKRKKVKKNHFEISYGSLNESQYILAFALEEKWIPSEQYDFIYKIGDEIGAMLWTEIEYLET